MTFILMAAIASAQPLPIPACPIERPVYRLRGSPEFTTGFARQDRRKSLASNLAFWLRTPDHTFWFAMESPNGYGGLYVRPDIDPRRSVRLDDEAERAANERIETLDPPRLPLDAFRADLSAYDNAPQADDPPPALLFARALGPALWYDWTRLGGGDPGALQESMPIGLFEPAGCDGPPPERP